MNTIDTIKQKSGILSWSLDNINQSPSEPGVLILRSSPTTDSIRLIEASSNLKEDLLVKIADVSLSEIVFFDWYSTNSFATAETLAKSWNEKYIGLEFD